MKFSLAIIAAISAGVAAFDRVTLDGAINADSGLGLKLLSQARLLNEDEVEATWVAGYSLKFQGCYNIKQWNANANEQNDVKIATKSLVRFRLCPTSGCSEQKAAGCTSGHGDYIIDMKTFIASYYEFKKQLDEQNCETMLNNCNCDEAENQDYCKYDCAVAAEMTQCVDGNPYEEGGGEQADDFDVENYLACARFEGYANNGGEAQEAENAQEGEGADGEEEQAAEGEGDGERKLEDEYFLGAYCANQGGAILLGLFTEDSCTEFADDSAGKTTYNSLTGMTLPYSDASLVGMECLSCLGESEEQQAEGEEAEGEEQQASVGEQCANLYSAAGKCESSLPDGLTDSRNTNGCSFIDGVKIVRTDGIVSTSSKSSRNPVAISFIVIFAFLFAALAFYVWYLRKRIGVKKDSLM